MDLPSCPSCGQSVLDENPESCPFCGEPMGKGSSATQPSEPAPKKKQLTSKDEDPFAIEANSQKATVRVAIRRAQGRTHAVKCPMCETAGFVPESAAGKSVKCANPACMVPVFEAPELAKEEEPVEEKSGTSLSMIIFSALLMSMAGFAVWFFVLKEDTPVVDPNPPITDNDPPVVDPTVNDPNPETKNPDPKVVEPTFDAVGFRQQLLDKTMQEISRQRTRNSKSNRPPDCRQLLSETYARVGQLDNAQGQLTHIDKQSPQTFFNKRLLPLIEIIWRQEDPAIATELLSQAEKAASEIPLAGRLRFNDLSALAALLVAQGREKDAQRWIAKAVENANVTNAERLDRLRQSSSHLRVLRDLPDYQFSPLSQFIELLCRRDFF